MRWLQWVPYVYTNFHLDSRLLYELEEVYSTPLTCWWWWNQFKLWGSLLSHESIVPTSGYRFEREGWHGEKWRGSAYISTQSQGWKYILFNWCYFLFPQIFNEDHDWFEKFTVRSIEETCGYLRYSARRNSSNGGKGFDLKQHFSKNLI